MFLFQSYAPAQRKKSCSFYFHTNSRPIIWISITITIASVTLLYYNCNVSVLPITVYLQLSYTSVTEAIVMVMSFDRIGIDNEKP